MSLVGQPLDRVDGPAKVSGHAPYAGDFTRPRLAHAELVLATIPSGRVAAIDSRRAQRMPGVLAVMTHENAPRLPNKGNAEVEPPARRALTLLQDDEVRYSGQPIALVVAETLEQARAATAALEIRYAAQPARLDFARERPNAHKPDHVQRKDPDSQRGDLEAGLRAGRARHEARYSTPLEHHNPMEPHATLAAWDGDRLELVDSTQYVSGVKHVVATALGIPEQDITVLCPYTGGGFGCKGSTWSHVVLAAMAARVAGRPVKLVLDRTQMFGPVGCRPRTEQALRVAIDGEGALTGVEHRLVSETSTFEEWTEPSAMITRSLYACPNVVTSHRLVRLNMGTPTFMRAPGEATGSFALESALDEVAHAAGIDPLALRLASHAQRDPDKDLPFSSKSLRECYHAAAERFGWGRRMPQPGSMRDGRWRVGMGMATATYPTNRSPASALARLLPDGSALVQSGSQDLGTGTYTAMTQVAADALGLPAAKVRFELGDTRMPRAPVSGGSCTVASVSPAVKAACEAVRARLVEAACTDPESIAFQRPGEDVTIEDGWIRLRSRPSAREPIGAVVGRHALPIEAVADATPGDEKRKWSMHAFGAVFVEVRVDPDLGLVRVPRIVGAYGIGAPMNAKTARSQLMGGIVWGMSMALFEETWRDVRNGRHVNGNLAEYHVPVNADVHDIDVIIVPEGDPHVNPLGAKGIGEIGITGVPAAIAGAVWHATGRRVRDLPITLDKLLP